MSTPKMNMFALCLAVLLLAGTALGAPQRLFLNLESDRIVGGREVNIEDFPYQVAMEHMGGLICGGCLVSASAVLTAAHCTTAVGLSPLLVTIRAGSSIRESGGQTVKVTEIRQHPYYNTATTDRDVSVLILTTAIEPNYGQPIPLATDVPADGLLATVSGWGTTKSGGDLPEHLMAVDVPKVSIESCRKSYPDNGPIVTITNNMLCYGYEAGGKDSCQGDSGGPLVDDGKLVGLVSWGQGCAEPGYPGVYASVPALKLMIDCLLSTHSIYCFLLGPS